MNRTILALTVFLSTLAASQVLAQTNLSPVAKFCWGENVGFINCRDAGVTKGAQGVRTSATFLSGFAWGENIGYINFGDGAPDFGSSYSNPTGFVVGVPDFGVNRDAATGNLTGFAWGENIGWINFSGGALATPPQPARIDPLTKRFRGYAWGENIGWINLDDANIFVSACAADFNNDGNLNVSDIFAFLTAWFASNPNADYNGTNGDDVADIFVFLTAWFSGC